jgi:hypothetical protein
MMHLGKENDAADFPRSSTVIVVSLPATWSKSGATRQVGFDLSGAIG